VKTALLATTSAEVPIFFDTGEATLFGVLTVPTGPRRDVAVIILPGGGTPLSTNVNRFSVRFCRKIAADGFHAFRFDYHGVGESTGSAGAFHLGAPFVADVEAATRALHAEGLKRFAIVGSCFGARTALSSAAANLGVIGLATICLPIRDFEMGERVATRVARDFSVVDYMKHGLRLRTLRTLADKRHRRTYRRIVSESIRRRRIMNGGESRQFEARYHVSPDLVEALRTVVERPIPSLLMYGEEDDLLADLQKERSALDFFLGRPEIVTELVMPGKLHGYPTIAAQDAVLGALREWLEHLTKGALAEDGSTAHGEA